MPSDKLLDCIVAGDANVDLIMTGVPPLEWGKEKTFAGLDLALGGSSAITAFNLASFGVRISFIGIVGKDSFGDFVRSRLEAGSVDTSSLKFHPKEKTGITVWHSDLQRNRAGMTYPGTIALLCASDISEEVLATARHLHIGHYFLLDKLHAQAASLFRLAKNMGLSTSLDCNFDPTEQWDSGIREVLEYTDIFFPNEDEANRLTGCQTAEESGRELCKLAGTVAVKLGARGVLVHHDGEMFREEAPQVKVADTTGAGDSFNAGYLSAFLKGGSTKQCAQAGIAAASRCVMHVGGTAAFATGQ